MILVKAAAGLVIELAPTIRAVDQLSIRLSEGVSAQPFLFQATADGDRLSSDRSMPGRLPS